MSGKTLVSLNKAAVALALTAMLALTACGEDGKFAFPTKGNAGADDSRAPSPAQGLQLAGRDIEAPEAFQVTEPGLWDGRPSLGGVWVAHPDVTEPERVIIRNQTNGTSVIGALFRRERDNPGPALQVSSDAAATLEMLAGAPAQLQVTALRREDVADAPQSMPDDFEAPADITTSPINSTPLAASDPIAEAAPANRPAAAPVASTLSKPYIQIGIFSVEANANGIADQMRTAGVVSDVSQQDSQGRTFWRVIAGPATTEAERAELLRKIKAQGFEDAYFVSN